MALKTLHLRSNLPRPSSYTYSFSRLSSPSYQPSRVATKKKHHHRKASTTAPALRCRANLHGCTDEVVQAPRDQTAEIPIVMHPSVVFPGAALQLQTSEFRYRIMMQTLRQQGLTWFGVVYSGASTTPYNSGGVAMAGDVGCAVHVLGCESLVDDRFFLTCAAGDRFRVVEIVRTKPFVVARVQVLRDRPGAEPQEQDGRLGALVRQVGQHLENVAVLSDKLNQRRPWGDHRAAAEQLHIHSPRSAPSFSFLVARLFVDDRVEQLTLLQMDDTAQRLAREGMYLERRSKYLAALAAIKDAFQHLSCNET